MYKSIQMLLKADMTFAVMPIGCDVLGFAQSPGGKFLWPNGKVFDAFAVILFHHGIEIDGIPFCQRFYALDHSGLPDGSTADVLAQPWDICLIVLPDF